MACSGSVLALFRLCSSSVPVLFQLCFMSTLGLFQICSGSVLGLFQICSGSAPGLFYVCPGLSRIGSGSVPGMIGCVLDLIFSVYFLGLVCITLSFFLNLFQSFESLQVFLSLSSNHEKSRFIEIGLKCSATLRI